MRNTRKSKETSEAQEALTVTGQEGEGVVELGSITEATKGSLGNWYDGGGGYFGTEDEPD